MLNFNEIENGLIPCGDRADIYGTYLISEDNVNLAVFSLSSYKVCLHRSSEIAILVLIEELFIRTKEKLLSSGLGKTWGKHPFCVSKPLG